MSRFMTRVRVLRARLAGLPRRVKLLAAGFLVAIVALVAAFLLVGAGPLGGATDYGAADASPAPYDGRSPNLPAAGEQRVLVQLPRPALGAVDDDLDAAGQRAYVASLRDEARALISALGARGVRLRDVVTYTKAWHGFSATVGEADRPRLESLGVRVRTNRRLFPQLSDPVTVSPEAVAPRQPGAGAPRVALLAGGVAGAPGYDAIGRDRDPRGTRDEDGGEPLAAVLRAQGVRVRAIRVSGERRISELVGSEELGRTDELLNGLEHAVDPDGDGATDDHEPVALLGVSSPFAGFADSPEAEAVAGARRLGTLVVAPTGAEGTPATGSSTIGSPGAAPRALAVGPLVTPGLVLRTSLTVGNARIRRAAVLGRGPLPRTLRTAATPVAATTAARLLGEGSPPLQGRVAVVRANGNPAAQAAAAAGAGAVAVVLARTGRGPLPSMPAGRVDVPVLGVTGAGARAVLNQEGGATVRSRGLQVPRVPFGRPFGTRPTAFASVGSTLAGRPAPDVLRPGSVVAGGRLVSGGAVAAAVAAAQAARASGGAAAREAAVEGAGGVTPGATATPTATPAPAASDVPVGRLTVVRRAGATGVLFVVGAFNRGDVAAGQPTTLVPAARLTLTLDKADGGVVERLTPAGAERDVLPGQYAYTLRPAVVRRLAKGRYRFRVRARGPGQQTPTSVTSDPFPAG